MADDLAEHFSRLEAYFLENNSTIRNWNGIRDVFNCLKEKVKDPDNRARISLLQINKTKQVLLLCKQVLEAKVMEMDESVAACISTNTELLRFLRNTAAGAAQSQENIMSSGIIEQVIEITRILLKPVYQESCISDSANGSIKSAVQLLGNLVVGNTLTQDYVWRQCFPEFFLLVMTCLNNEIQNCMCMVIYNCMSLQRRNDLVSSQKGFKIMAQVLHMCADHENLEWGYFILETLITNGHVPDLYQGLEFDPSARIILLDLIQVHLTGSQDEETQPHSQPQNDKPATSAVSDESFIFFAQEFEKDSYNVFSEKEGDFFSSDNMLNAVLFTRLLRLLSSASAIHKTSLQNRHQLLYTALDLLRQANDPANRSQFSKVNSTTRSQRDNLSPSHGFKRDLVRLIGNMCHKNRSNQDTVREKEGIPLLLDHCNIDDHNPYICQWAVFALRNILEDNLDNQQIVASLDKRGIVDHSRLHQFGVDIKKTNDGKVQLVQKGKE